MEVDYGDQFEDKKTLETGLNKGQSAHQVAQS